MLTSPVVTIAAANGAGLKANTAASDNLPRREPQALAILAGQSPEMVIEPELPSNSPTNHVNAVAATVGSRTVLQELTLNIAALLRVARRPDENLTALFLRIISKIEAMPQAERLAFEIRAGLKPLKITLADLAMALRKPDGPEAARLTAMSEAPAAVPGRTVANTATTTYLEEGTSNGHAEETLAMRAAARSSAAGQSVFTAESKLRPEAPPADAKVLQTQMMALFEPGEAEPAKDVPAPDAAPVDVPEAEARTEEMPDVEDKPIPLPKSATPRDTVAITISSANLKFDPPTVEKIRNAAQAIANQATEGTRGEAAERPMSEKPDAGDRRMQTLLTLKGFAEAVTAIPARAAELLASVVAEAASPLPDTGDATAKPEKNTTPLPPIAVEQAESSELPTPADAQGAEPVVETMATAELPVEPQPETAAIAEEQAGEQAEAAKTGAQREAATAERPQLARTDLTQHAVPFAYAPVQPARDGMVDTVKADESRGDGEEDGRRDADDEDEQKRSRDEYDEIHNPLPEEEDSIVINRDSSEADRAFALYQRMGGF
ncbi:hypothetical protein [Rhizobium sp.]